MEFQLELKLSAHKSQNTFKYRDMKQEELLENFVGPLADRAGKDLMLGESDLDINQKHKINLPGSIKSRIPHKILSYYNEILYFKLAWTYKKDKSIRGFIRILPIEEAVGDWEGKVYFKKRDPEHMKDFKVLDFFLPECCVGFYLAGKSGKPKEELYVFDREDVPVGLNVDVEGYIQLLYMARGFAYWPRVLQGLAGQEDAGVTEKFKKSMPKVFPDFKWEEFVALYEKVKLK